MEQLSLQKKIVNSMAAEAEEDDNKKAMDVELSEVEAPEVLCWFNFWAYCF
jgi:hypothetical protein